MSNARVEGTERVYTLCEVPLFKVRVSQVVQMYQDTQYLYIELQHRLLMKLFHERLPTAGTGESVGLGDMYMELSVESLDLTFWFEGLLEREVQDFVSAVYRAQQRQLVEDRVAFGPTRPRGDEPIAGPLVGQ